MANGKLRRPMRTLGMQMRNFGRNLMRFYFGSRQAADQPPALPPPSWQRHTDTPLDWAAPSDQAAENVETAQYGATDALAFPSEPLAGRPTSRPQRSQPQMPPATPSQAASTTPVQRSPQSAAPTTPPAPAARPTQAPMPRTAAQMSDDARLANIMEFHRQREREQQRLHEERIQRMKAQTSTPESESTTTDDDPPVPRRRRGASFEYIETSTLRSGEDDAPAASGTTETAIQRQEREISDGNMVVDTGSADEVRGFSEDLPEDWIEDTDVAAHEPLERAHEDVTSSGSSLAQNVPDSPQVPVARVQRQPDTSSAEVTAHTTEQNPNAPPLTPPTTVAAPPVQRSVAAAAERLEMRGYPDTIDEAAPDTSGVQPAHSDDLTQPDDPFAINQAVGADPPANISLGAPAVIMRSTDVSQSPPPSTVPIDLEVGGDTSSAAWGGSIISNETSGVAATADEALASSTRVQRTVVDGVEVKADVREVPSTLVTAEDAPQAPDGHDFVTTAPASPADMRQPQYTVPDTSTEATSQESEGISVSSTVGVSAATSTPNSPIIAAIQRSTNADTSLSSEYVSWDQLPTLDTEPAVETFALPAQMDQEAGTQSSVAAALGAQPEASQTEGDVPFTQSAEHASTTALSPATVQRVPSALIDTMETEFDSEGNYPTPAAPVPTQDSTRAVTDERRASVQVRSDEPQGTAMITSTDAVVPAISVGTAPRDKTEARASESIQRVSDVTPPSVVPARYVMPETQQSPTPEVPDFDNSEAVQRSLPAAEMDTQAFQHGEQPISSTVAGASATVAADNMPDQQSQSAIQRSSSAFPSESSSASLFDVPENAAVDWQEDVDEDSDFDGGEFNAAQPDLYQALIAAGAITPSVPTVQRTPETNVPQAKVPDANSTEAELLKWLNLPPNTPVTGSLRGDVPVSTAPNVQRALPQSSADASLPEQQEENPETDDASGSVDVDKLARDVYSVLRNRLRIERERRNNK